MDLHVHTYRTELSATSCLAAYRSGFVTESFRINFDNFQKSFVVAAVVVVVLFLPSQEEMFTCWLHIGEALRQ